MFTNPQVIIEIQESTENRTPDTHPFIKSVNQENCPSGAVTGIQITRTKNDSPVKVDRLTVPVIEKPRHSLNSKSISVTLLREGTTGINTETRSPSQATPATPAVRTIDPRIAVDAATADERSERSEPIETETTHANDNRFSTWMREHRKNVVASRKLQLDSEPVVVYQKKTTPLTGFAAGSGEIVASVIAHKRKRFALPSLDERYYRYRMLKVQEENRAHQKEKLQQFMSKIRNDG